MKLIIKIWFLLLASYIAGCTDEPEKRHLVQSQMMQADILDIVYYETRRNDE